MPDLEPWQRRLVDAFRSGEPIDLHGSHLRRRRAERLAEDACFLAYLLVDGWTLTTHRGRGMIEASRDDERKQIVFPDYRSARETFDRARLVLEDIR